MKRQFFHLVGLVLVISLSACGGGGGGGGGGSGSGGGTESGDGSGGSGDGSGGGTELSPLEQALASGDAQLVEQSSVFVKAALTSITDNQNLLFDAKIELFNLTDDGGEKTNGSSLTAISWNPTHDSSTFHYEPGRNTPVLLTNAVTDPVEPVQQRVVGVIGETDARYLFLGGNPLRNHYQNNTNLNDQMHQFMENAMSWLTARDDLSSSAFNVVIAHQDESFYFPDETAVRAWLDDHYAGQANYNAAGSCDDQALTGCLADGPDLLIISQILNTGSNPQQIVDTVSLAMDRGIPVLYMHHDGNHTSLGDALFELFDVRYQFDNYWHKLQLVDYDPRDTFNLMSDDVQSIQTMLMHFRDQDYLFDWSVCDDENCDAVVGLQEDFLDGAEAVREMMTGFDESKINLFAHEGFRFQKLLALLGDHYRQKIRLPMDKVTSNSNAFMQAYYADHAVYNYRNINPVQADMGNFSRSDFSHITPVDKTITLTSKANFRSLGVYALPGQTLRVTRTDNSAVEVGIFVNTQRSGSTHHWAQDGYKRPKFLKSPTINIEPGETIEFTSPYGGPLQAKFNVNGFDISLDFENIGEHAYWRDSSQDDSFTEKLIAGDYDWAELVTPGFEVHSSLEKMRESLADPKWGSAQSLADATMRYIHNYPHVLAGFKGPAIDVVPEIHDFATAHNLTIDNIDIVKHMNADQAFCGYGCSGNPYDAYWSFDPVAHGDVHELGHGLQTGSISFDSWINHSMTNPYSYYTKSKYHQLSGGDADCQNLPFDDLYQVLQDSVSAGNPVAYVDTQLWVEKKWDRGASVFIQLMMTAEGSGALSDGWNLLPRLHILDREFKRAINGSEANWNSVRSDLGFSQYSLADARAASKNDWMLVSLSFATKRDYRDYLTMWALPYSNAAGAQVVAAGYTPIARDFYVSSAAGYCHGEGFDGTKVPVDGTTPWPL